KRSWVHEINICRKSFGEFYHLYRDARKYPEKFYEYLRMSKESFDLLLSHLDPYLCGIGTNFRERISAEQRLVITLRFLATGESYRSLALHFRLGVATVSNIVNHTCMVIWDTMKSDYLPKPTQATWHNKSQQYWTKWNFPNCIGSIDGKHIEVKCPSNTGSLYYNYKQYFSILLQALVDADCKLIAVDIGSFGRQSDGGNFRSSSLFRALDRKELDVPPDQCLPQTNIKAPLVIVGDEAYPLLPYLMRPYPRRNLDNSKRIFNYRLSRARRCAECAFGIMSGKWRILLKPIETKIETAINIVKAICILHNFVIEQEGFKTNKECQTGFSGDINPSTYTHSQYRFSEDAKRTREILTNYFVTTGAVEWQNQFSFVQ
ncbi:unnamed protein product, partial [Acanthoscelides obtectus]